MTSNVKRLCGSFARASKAPVLVLWLLAFSAPVHAQAVAVPDKIPVAAVSPTSTSRPAFEVASVKLNSSCGAERRPNVRPSPGRLTVSCVPLRRLIRTAYGGFADGAMRPVRPEVLGGPAWVDSELYDIEAKASYPAPFDQVNGVMLQVLLEERFKVEVRQEFREEPAYLLTVTKTGPRLHAAKGANCIPDDPNEGPPRLAPGEPYRCGMARERSNAEGIVCSGYGLSVADIAGQILARHVDRPIIDRTGLTGKFDVHLAFVPTLIPQGPVRLNGVDVPSLPPVAGDAPLSVFSAVEQQLGLKLSPGKGSIEFLIVTHAERPSAN